MHLFIWNNLLLILIEVPHIKFQHSIFQNLLCFIVDSINQFILAFFPITLSVLRFILMLNLSKKKEKKKKIFNKINYN